MVNCPECVSREIAKRKKQLEADFKAEEQEEGYEFRAPPYRELEEYGICYETRSCNKTLHL